jgi:hypothetical protein
VAKLARDGRLAADWNRWRGHTYAPSTHPAGLPPANCVAAGSSAGSVHCAEAALTITVLMAKRMETSIVAQTAARAFVAARAVLYQPSSSIYIYIDRSAPLIIDLLLLL